MIIRLLVILVSHIASRPLIELDVRLAAGGRAARTREPWYAPTTVRSPAWRELATV